MSEFAPILEGDWDEEDLRKADFDAARCPEQSDCAGTPIRTRPNGERLMKKAYQKPTLVRHLSLTQITADVGMPIGSPPFDDA
jgi:hypothetical protein